MESQKIYGRNVCPREKPHLQKIGTCYWVQHWPDGWKQRIITWRDTTVPQALPREPVKSAPKWRPLNAGIQPFGAFNGEKQ